MQRLIKIRTIYAEFVSSVKNIRYDEHWTESGRHEQANPTLLQSPNNSCKVEAKEE